MKNILITGRPGAGKTTICKKIVDKFRNVPLTGDGFYTEEVRNDRRQRIGFNIVNLNDSNKVTLADKRDIPPSNNIKKLGQYTVYVKNVEDFAVPIILKSNKKILIIDEIGKMELFSKQFQQAVDSKINDKNTIVIATVPVKGPPFVTQLKHDPSCQLFEVNEQSRNQLADDIIHFLLAELGSISK